MARIKYFNQKTGKWEYADSQYSVVNNNSSNSNIYVQSDEPQSADDGSLWVDLDGSIEQAHIEPADDDIPEVFFGGALPQTKDDTIMSFRYISKTQDISGYCKTKAQGNSSMGYPKKNQTVKLYSDAECTKKLKVDFKGWGKQNKFCFKANWVDLTHARNIVSARLWGDVVKSRHNYESIPELLRTSPNQGAVDGFPIKVYSQGVYQGRYTINIPKDAWMANMDDDLDEHCIICGENYVSGCFRAEAKLDESDWTDEVHDTVPASIKTRWNEAIRFVMNSTDPEFAAGIGNYFDLDSLIDYYLFGLVTCNNDGFGKNQLYHTYDGQKWYATVYDVDNTFGTYLGGILPVDFSRDKYEDYKHAGGNLLYVRLESLFARDIKARYEELKNGPLSLPNIINRFVRFTNIAPTELVKDDYASTTADGAFNGIPLQGKSNIQQIRNYIVKRYSYIDTYIEELGMSGTLLYKLDNPVTVNSAAWTGAIETDVKLFDEPKSFTLICEATLDEDCPAGKKLWSCTNEYTGWEDPATGAAFFQASTHADGGLYFTGVPNTWCEPYFGSYEAGKAAIPSKYSKHAVIVKNGVPTDLYFITEDGGEVQHMTPAYPLSYFQHDGILSLGCGMYSYGENNLIDGTIHAFEIWDYAMSAEEIAEKFNSQQGYTPVEYIESNGANYIDTGVSGGTNASYELKASVSSDNTTNWSTVFGTSSHPIPSIVYLSSHVFANCTDVEWLCGLGYDNIFTVRYEAEGQLYLNNNAVSMTKLAPEAGSGWGADGWHLFCAPSNGLYQSFAKARIYSLKMYTDEVLVRDFLPVKRKSDGVYGLFDKISNAFFDGTGGFTGPSEILYELLEEVTFDGTQDQQIDTGVMLFDEPKDFSIVIDLTSAEDCAKHTAVFSANKELEEYIGGITLTTYAYDDRIGYDTRGYPGNGGAMVFNGFEHTKDYNRRKFVFIFNSGIPVSAHYMRDDYVQNCSPTYTPGQPIIHDMPLVLGGNNYGQMLWSGTIHAMEVWGKALTEEEIAEKLSDKSDILYELPEATVFDGSSVYIDTGVKLFDTAKDFTVFVDFDGVAPTSGAYGYLLSSSIHENLDNANLHLGYEEGNSYPNLRASGKNNHAWEDVEDDFWGHSWDNLQRISLVYVGGVFSFGKYLKKNDTTVKYIHAQDGVAYSHSEEPLRIGAAKSFWDSGMRDYWTGTVNECRVYNRAMTEDEVARLVGSE